MRRLVILLLLALLGVPAVAQSGPELDALMEMVFAKDVKTLLRHVPPELSDAFNQLPPATQREVAAQFLISAKLQQEGVKVERPESGAVLVVERAVPTDGGTAETREEAEIFLERRLTDGEETLLRFRLEPKNGMDSDRDIRVSIGMRYVDDEWRIYEVEGGQVFRLDDTKLLDRFVESRQLSNAASAIGCLRTYNTALVTYSASYPDNGFPASLTALGGEGGSPDHAGLIDNLLSSPPFEKSGYRFRYNRSSQTEYSVTARPIESDSKDTRSFYTDQSGVIRYTTEDRDATADDPPLQ